MARRQHTCAPPPGSVVIDSKTVVCVAGAVAENTAQPSMLPDVNQFESVLPEGFTDDFRGAYLKDLADNVSSDVATMQRPGLGQTEAGPVAPERLRLQPTAMKPERQQQKAY